MSNILKRTLLSNKKNLFLLQGLDFSGRSTWHIIKLNFPQRRKLEAQLTKALPVNISDYGEIIDAGYDTPPQEATF